MKLTFSEALNHLKEGKKVTRPSWNGSDMFLFLVHGSLFNVNRAPLLGIYPLGTEIRYRAHIDIRLPNGDIGTWSPSNGDVLAEDWTVVDEVVATSSSTVLADLVSEIHEADDRAKDDAVWYRNRVKDLLTQYKQFPRFPVEQE